MSLCLKLSSLASLGICAHAVIEKTLKAVIEKALKALVAKALKAVVGKALKAVVEKAPTACRGKAREAVQLSSPSALVKIEFMISLVKLIIKWPKPCRIKVSPRLVRPLANKRLCGFLRISLVWWLRHNRYGVGNLEPQRK